MSKFKVGDTVKIIDRKHGHKFKIGQTVILKSTSGDDWFATNLDEEDYWCITEEEFELVQPKAFTKQDLNERWLVKTRNGYEWIIEVDKKGDLQLEKMIGGKVNRDSFEHLYLYKDDLKNVNDKDYDIVEVYKPTYETVWTRTEDKPIEMSISEIKEALHIDEDVEFKIKEEK